MKNGNWAFCLIFLFIGFFIGKAYYTKESAKMIKPPTLMVGNIKHESVYTKDSVYDIFMRVDTSAKLEEKDLSPERP